MKIIEVGLNFHGLANEYAKNRFIFCEARCLDIFKVADYEFKLRMSDLLIYSRKGFFTYLFKKINFLLLEKKKKQ